MPRKFPKYEERHFQTADELWLALSPTSDLTTGISKFVYRGHGDASWLLIPSILRRQSPSPFIPADVYNDAGTLVLYEMMMMLHSFITHCDSIGIQVVGDSLDFRENVVNIQRNSRFFKKPKLWPNKLAFNLMAMAQHHGVPTRLLDWTINAGVAMYFAANGAIGGYSEWTNASKLAVWALDSDRLSLSPHITLFYAPGSVSAHLAAQGGLFSVHPSSGNQAGEFQALSLEDYFVDVPSPLIKLTIPAFEAVRLMHLCNKSGINAARVYPTADGAGKAVIDDFKMGLALEYWNKTEILVRR